MFYSRVARNLVGSREKQYGDDVMTSEITACCGLVKGLWVRQGLVVG